MSILGDIFGKIFHRAQAQPAPQQPGSTNTTASAPQPTTPGTTTSSPARPMQPETPQAQPQSSSAATATAERVDVEPILDGMLASKGQQLNWRTSIVDLLKLLDLDSSLQARKALADELHYSGDRNDSAAMNIWLHKQVMRKLEENGGKVPADLKD